MRDGRAASSPRSRLIRLCAASYGLFSGTGLLRSVHCDSLHPTRLRQERKARKKRRKKGRQEERKTTRSNDEGEISENRPKHLPDEPWIKGSAAGTASMRYRSTGWRPTHGEEAGPRQLMQPNLHAFDAMVTMTCRRTVRHATAAGVLPQEREGKKSSIGENAGPRRSA